MSRVIVIGGHADSLVAARALAPRYEVVVIAENQKPETVHSPDPWLAAPLPAGGRLELWRDMARTAEAIRRVSSRDAEHWPGFCERMARLARFLEGVYSAPPPDPLGIKFALRARRMGKQGLADFLRILPMPVAELLDDWFESDVLKGTLGAAGILHLQQGPRSGGTAFRLLHHHVGSPPGVFRPPASSPPEMLPSQNHQQGRVAQISVREGRATGVVLENGQEIEASLVVSGADPRRTLLELVEPGWLDPELVRALGHLRRRGVVARVVLRLDRSPGFARLALAPSLDYLERACDDSKYGRVSQRPYLEAHCDERHHMQVHVQYVPYGADCSALGETVVALLSEHWGDAVAEEVEVHSPRDLEEREGWPEGQAHHAEL
ncbi:MAG: phytoene desaturase family protein, partial [Burkholderiales bacterium]